jgi:SPP1 gp7 family putative phage head morphogenesis protein
MAKELIQARRRQQAGRRPEQVAKVPKRPAQLEKEYTKELGKIADRFAESFEDELIDQLDSLASLNNDARNDSLIDQLRKFIDKAMAKYNKQNNTEELASRISAKTSRFNKEQLVKSLGTNKAAAMLSDEAYLAGTLSSFVRENAKLVKAANEEFKNQIADVVEEGFKKGSGTKVIAKKIRGRLSVNKSRSALIARDQVGKLNGNLTTQRHTKLGIRKFRWVTVGDSRVRDEHSSLNGRVFTYDNPPAVGLPGSPVQCRCVAIAIFKL